MVNVRILAAATRATQRVTTRWDAAQAGFMGALGILLYALRVYSNNAVLPEWVVAAALPVLVAAQVIRRTHPALAVALVAAASTADMLAGPSMVSILVFIDTLYAAAFYGSYRLTKSLFIGGGAIVILAGFVAVLIPSLTAGDRVWLLVQSALLLLMPLVTGLEVRRYRDRARAETERAEQMARLTELDRQAALSAERTRMARELHDVIANHLSAISIQSTAALTVPDLDRDAITDVLTTIRESSVKGLAEMKEMIFFLRDGESGEIAAPTATGRLDDVERLLTAGPRPDTPARLEVIGSRRQLPAAVDLAAYRIVQESLTNAGRHGGPGPIVVTLDFQRDALEIRVRNTIPVVRPNERSSALSSSGAGAGILGMRERADLLGGEFHAGPDKKTGSGTSAEVTGGGGWLVRARLPTRKT